MEMIIAAIMGELASRSISLLLDKCLDRRTAPTGDERLDTLQQLLLRAHVIVEEAEGRRVTNQAMLRQLNKLRDEMYRGYYTLDMFRCRRNTGEVSHSSAMSQFNPAKRVCLILGNSNRQSERELEQVLVCLESMVADVKDELVVFLTRCPRLHCQPYSMYMILDRCMFGRQMETELVVAFLLQTDDHGVPKPGVLPIIGPKGAGKSTLVDHVCKDERVRAHFSQIVSLTLGDLRDESILTLRNGSVIKHQHGASDEDKVLVVVELNGERNSKGLDGIIVEGLLGRLYSICKDGTSCITKIIVTSRSNKIGSFETAEPLRLQALTQEAYWYFFKARAFGSTNAADHPKLASIAMDMAMEMGGSFATANIFGGLLRSNFNSRFWSLALTVLREFKKKNLLMYNAHQTNPNWKVTKPAYSTKVVQEFVFLDDYQIGSIDEVPKISMQDVMFGSARPRGKFDILGWKSPVPPHYSYAYRCEIRRPQRLIIRKKRLMHDNGNCDVDHLLCCTQFICP
ncbi:hypothetical protein ACP70R_015116 [Stipagrostis hirtigluma subsp. patula]